MDFVVGVLEALFGMSNDVAIWQMFRTPPPLLGSFTLFLKCTGEHNDPTFVKNAPLAATPARDPRQSRSNLCCRRVHLADPGRMQRLSQPYHVSEYSVRSGLRPFPRRQPRRKQDQNLLAKDFLVVTVPARSCTARSRTD